jgi:hypothetical protein
LTTHRVNILRILLSCVLPIYSEDARDLIIKLNHSAQKNGPELDIQDGFDLYKTLAAVRRLLADALPEYGLSSLPGQKLADDIVLRKSFPFSIEDLLEEFVWRWIRETDGKILEWVDQAVKQDSFTVRTETSEEVVAQEQRHSVSSIDIFRSFNQVVEQLIALEWDSDLQYAKFMTALAKSIGRGVARYCEVIEQSFTKEMDRLSPEQEAAATQTRQEKFMQMAKEAWNSKEKIEPFQFLPEV